MKDFRDGGCLVWFGFFPQDFWETYLFRFFISKTLKKKKSNFKKNSFFCMFFNPGNDTSEHCSCKDSSPTFIARLSVLNWPVRLLSFGVNVLA